MGARVKKTVREQLEELRTNDNVFDGGNENETASLGRNRKRKSASDCQEPLRKRVHAKDRVVPMFNQASSVPSVKQSAPVTQPLLRHSLSQPLPSHPAQSSFLRAPLPPPLIPNSHLVKVLGADAVVRLAQHGDVVQLKSGAPSSTELSQTFAQAPLQSHPAVRLPVCSSVRTASVSQQIASGINPVQQTLALLGIRTPMRRSDANINVVPGSSITSDNMRRRIAIRETSASGSRMPGLPVTSRNNISASIDTTSVGTDLLSRGVVLQREGYQLLSRDQSSAHEQRVLLPYNKPNPTTPG